MPPELFPRPTFSLNPEAGRTGPKLWVKRIVIWREPNVVREGGSLDDLFSGKHQATGMVPLVDVITRSILGDSPKLMPSSIGSESAWKALLAWITRDQECRFSHVLNWRSSESNSSSPVVNRSGEDKLLVVRAILGALSLNEVTAQQKEEIESKNLTGKKSDLDRLKWQIERAHASVYTKLRREGELLAGTPVNVALLKKAATEQLSKVLNLPERIGSGEVQAVRRERDAAKE